MKTMQKDIVDKYVQLNGSEEGLVKNVKEKYPSNKKRILEAITKANEKDAMKAYIEKMSNGDGELILNAPHETLLVIDAATGQNGIMQANAFKEITNMMIY